MLGWSSEPRERVLKLAACDAAPSAAQLAAELAIVPKVGPGACADLLCLQDVQLRLGAQEFGPFNLQLRAGERVAILGRSGAGKSSLLKLIAGEHRPQRGRVLLDGCDLALWPAAAMAGRRAVLPQSHAVAFPLSVELVARLGRIAFEPDPQGAAIVDAALQEVHAGHLRGRRFDTLSGGEQARVQLARVLAQLWDRPAGLLLVDEPLAALDPGLQVELQQVLLRYCSKRGHALIAIVHDIGQALSAYQRLWLIQQRQLWIDCGADRQALAHLEDLFGVQLRAIDDGDDGFVVAVRGRGAC